MNVPSWYQSIFVFQINSLEDKYCTSCTYPLNIIAYEEIKQQEDKELQAIAERHEQEMKVMREEMENKFQQLLTKIDVARLRQDFHSQICCNTPCMYQ